LARIVGHLCVAELEARYRAASDVAQARHAQAIWLLAQGRTVAEVAGVLAFTPRWVEMLAARYNAHGPEVLGDGRRRNGGAASVLTETVLEALRERLKTPPDDGGLWTGPKVALWMAAQLGVERVHPQRGWEALKRLEWSLRIPRPRHPRAAGAEERAEFANALTLRLSKQRQHTRTGPSRSGPRTSTASA